MRGETLAVCHRLEGSLAHAEHLLQMQGGDARPMRPYPGWCTLCLSPRQVSNWTETRWRGIREQESVVRHDSVSYIQFHLIQPLSRLSIRETSFALMKSLDYKISCGQYQEPTQHEIRYRADNDFVGRVLICVNCGDKILEPVGPAKCWQDY